MDAGTVVLIPSAVINNPKLRRIFMAEERKRITCTVDGIAFDAVDAVFLMNTRKIEGGKIGAEGFSASAHIRINPENKNITFQTLKGLFDLANAPGEAKYKPMKIEFWKHGVKRDVICTYSFTGWISSFRTSNVGSDVSKNAYNHVIDLELTPVIERNDLKIGN
jgi:hypothetical protein